METKNWAVSYNQKYQRDFQKMENFLILYTSDKTSAYRFL